METIMCRDMCTAVGMLSSKGRSVELFELRYVCRLIESPWYRSCAAAPLAMH